MQSKKPRRIYEIYKCDENRDNNITVLSNQGILAFNKVASYIWELMDGKNTIEEIIHKINEKFDNPFGETVGTDVMEFLRDLEEKNLIIIDWQPLP